MKEDTFIQTSRRGGDGQLGGEDSSQGCGWRTRVDKTAAVRQGKAAAGRAGQARQQLADPGTDHETQGSSSGK